MKTYSVTVRREVEQTATFEIEAEDEDDARDQAENEIINLGEGDWDDGDTTADAEITKVAETSDDSDEPEKAAKETEGAENE